MSSGWVFVLFAAVYIAAISVAFYFATRRITKEMVEAEAEAEAALDRQEWENPR